MQTNLLINGQFVKGDGAAISALNPATGLEIAQVSEASMAQIEAAVSAAATAFKSYKKTTPRDRATMLLKLADAIEANAVEFAELESLNCGKPYLATLNDEIPAVADVFCFFAGAVRNMSGALAGEYLQLIRKAGRFLGGQAVLSAKPVVLGNHFIGAVEFGDLGADFVIERRYPEKFAGRRGAQITGLRQG